MGHMGSKGRKGALAALGSMASLLVVWGGAPDAAAQAPVVVVLSGEEDRLNAYDAETGAKRTVIPSSGDDPVEGLDINGEICVVPETAPWKPEGEIWFIAGEDTEQNTEPGVIKQGWGIFRLTGSSLDTLAAVQLAKLVPDSYVTEGDNPENYGCGVLPDGRIVTGDVGDQLPQDPATGQLIVWFPDEQTFTGSIGPDRNDFPRVPPCKIDVAIGTAGGIEIDGTDVLIASNRPNLDPPDLGGILRYDTTIWPTGEDPGDGCSRTDVTGEQLAAADRVGRELFIPQGAGLLTTPSDIVHSTRGTYFISNVFTGTVVEYSREGLPLGPVLLTLGQVGGITPFGIDVEPDGTLWIADIGVQGPGPAPAAGSVVRLDPGEQPLGPGATIDEGLEFPDGIGVVVLPAAGPSPSPSPAPSPSGRWLAPGAPRPSVPWVRRPSP
jgi:hypothetical protein